MTQAPQATVETGADMQGKAGAQGQRFKDVLHLDRINGELHDKLH